MLSRHCSRWLFQLTKRNSNRNFSTYYWFWKEEKKTLNSRDKNSINFLIFQFQYSSFPSLHLISVQNSEDKRLHIHIPGLPCQHHSQVVCNHSRAWNFRAPNHAPQRLVCQKQSTPLPRGSLSLEPPQDILEFHLLGEKPTKFLNIWQNHVVYQ